MFSLDAVVAIGLPVAFGIHKWRTKRGMRKFQDEETLAELLVPSDGESDFNADEPVTNDNALF